jgi:hypothetical protein
MTAETDIKSWFSVNNLVPTPTPNTRDRVLGSIRRYYDKSFENWSTDDLTHWLEDHHLKAKPKSTREELVDQVKSNWDSARTYGNHQAQQVFQGSQRSPLVSSWTDSELRKFLLEHGVISPASKREELELQAKEFLSSASSAGAAATSNVASAASSVVSQASDTISSAWYAATDAARLPYDYTSAKLEDAKDYIYSTWSDNELRRYLESKGVVNTPAEAKRDQLVRDSRSSKSTS